MEFKTYQNISFYDYYEDNDFYASSDYFEDEDTNDVDDIKIPVDKKETFTNDNIEKILLRI